MKYSKQIMSITELVKETGLSRDFYKRCAHHWRASSYCFRTAGGGKILFYTDKLDEHIRRGIFDE